MTKISAADILASPIERYPLATVACFDPTMGDLPRRRLDESTNANFLDRLAQSGAPAVLIGASTGHGHVRTPEELMHWFELSAQAPVGEMVLMALLRPEDGLDTNRNMLALLKRVGYQVVFFRPGTDLPPDASDNDVADSLKPLIAIAAECNLAIGLYSIPDVSGVRLTPEAASLLLRSKGGDHIVAVKVTEADFDKSTRRFFEHPDLTGLKIVQGWDTHMAKAFELGGGRCGVTSGPMSFAIFQYIHMFEAVQRGDWEEVSKSQLAVTQLFQAMQDDPTKFADLQRAKRIMGLGHPLTAEIEAAQVERVFDALQNISRVEDRQRLARSLDLMQQGPFHEKLKTYCD